MYRLQCVGVDGAAEQSATVGTYPDVSVFVINDAVNRAVNAATGQPQLIAEACVPLVGVLIIDEERTLTVEPNVFKL